MVRPRVLTDSERAVNRREASLRYNLIHAERCRVRKRLWDADNRELRNERSRGRHVVRKEAKDKADLDAQQRLSALLARDEARRARRNELKRAAYHARRLKLKSTPEHQDAPRVGNDGLDVLVVDEGHVGEATA
jgi:hypothetical protein